MRLRAIMLIVLIGVLISPTHTENFEPYSQLSELELVENSAVSSTISLNDDFGGDDYPNLSPGAIFYYSYELGFPYGEISWNYFQSDNPDIYSIYLDEISIENGTVDGSDEVFFDITGFDVGMYNLTINATNTEDATGWRVSTYWVEVFPALAPVFNEEPEETFMFEQSAVIYSLVWNISDYRLDSYTLYQDGLVNASGTSLALSKLLVTLDLLGLNDSKDYNFTIVVVDELGQSSNRTTIVSPMPLEAPEIIDRPNPNNLIDQADYLWLNWTFSDLNPDSYILYQDNVSIASGVWVNNTPISYRVHGLDKGDYNFTIMINETNGLETVDTVWVSTYDDQNPNFVSTPDNLEITYASFDNSLTWEVNDTYPDTYVIYKNGNEVNSDSWINGGEITLSIGSSIVGLSNYTIVVSDVSGNNISDTVWVEVIPVATKDPTLNYNPTMYFSDSDILSGIWNDTDNVHLQDANIQLVLINNNSQVVFSQNYFSETDINGYFEIDLLYPQILPGAYNWNITLSKTGYTTVTITFEVTISPMITLDPGIVHNPIVVVKEIDTISGTWQDFKDALIGSAVIQIYLLDNNSQTIPNISYQSITDANGYFEFSLNYSDILPGNYTWNLLLSKTGYISSSIFLEVSVLPLEIELSLIINPTMTQDEEYQIYTNVTTSGGVQSSLTLNEDGEPVSGVQVRLEVGVLLTNSSQSLIILTESTNSSGIATFTISADQTLVIQEILSIIASVDDPFVSETSTEINDSELPEVHENVIVPTTSTTPPATTPTDGEQFQGDTSQILLLSLAIITVLAVILIVIRSISGKRESGELERQLLEFYFIRNIQLLLIKNLNGLPVFEKKFSQLETDPTLLAGLSHALSMFIDEVSKGGGQVEYLERGDFSLISVRGTNTILTLVSGSGFPKRFNDQIIEACTQIESDVFPNVSDQMTIISSGNDKAVFEIFDYHGIPIGLLDKLMINTEKLENTNNGLSSSPAFEILGSYSERDTFQLNHLIDSIEAIGTSQEEMAKIILEAYSTKIIIPYVPQSEL